MSEESQILAFPATTLMELGFTQGFNTHVSFSQFCKLAASHPVVADRPLLEKDSSKRQPLPYKLIWTLFEGVIYVMAYRRTKLIGEQRLERNASVGFGGHVERQDLVFPVAGSLDVEATLVRNLRREMDEEIEFIVGEVPATASYAEVVGGSLELPGVHTGFIWDDSNDVGQHHVAVAMAMYIPQPAHVIIKEAELTPLGWLTLEEALALEKLEPWSNIYLRHIVEDVAGFKALFNMT